MSRWWPERVTVWLAPHKGQDPAPCFERELEARAPRRHAHVTCVLGGPSVRYRIVPWNDALTSRHQRQVLAASCFHETYGDASRGWAVHDHVARYGAAGLACAVESAWPQRLGQVASERGLKLVSVQPSLMHAHNALRRALAAELFWFVLEESAMTTLVLWRRDEPLHLKVLPTAPVQLATLLDREWFLAAVDAPRCPVYLARAPGPGQLGTRESGWRIVELPVGPAVPAVAHSKEAA